MQTILHVSRTVPRLVRARWALALLPLIAILLAGTTPTTDASLPSMVQRHARGTAGRAGTPTPTAHRVTGARLAGAPRAGPAAGRSPAPTCSQGRDGWRDPALRGASCTTLDARARSRPAELAARQQPHVSAPGRRAPSTRAPPVG